MLEQGPKQTSVVMGNSGSGPPEQGSWLAGLGGGPLLLCQAWELTCGCCLCDAGRVLGGAHGTRELAQHTASACCLA